MQTYKLQDGTEIRVKEVSFGFIASSRDVTGTGATRRDAFRDWRSREQFRIEAHEENLRTGAYEALDRAERETARRIREGYERDRAAEAAELAAIETQIAQEREAGNLVVSESELKAHGCKQTRWCVDFDADEYDWIWIGPDGQQLKTVGRFYIVPGAQASGDEAAQPQDDEHPDEYADHNATILRYAGDVLSTSAYEVTADTDTFALATRLVEYYVEHMDSKPKWFDHYSQSVMVWRVDDSLIDQKEQAEI